MPPRPLSPPSPSPFGLRTHLLGLALAILLPACGIGAVAAWYAVEGNRAAFQGRMVDTARALALALDAELAGDLRALAMLASLPAFDTADAAEMAPRIARAAVVLDAPLRATDPAGRLLAGTGPVPAGTEAGGLAAEILNYDPVNGTAYIRQPVLRGGQLVAVLTLDLQPARLQRLLVAQNPGPGRFAALTDAADRLVARSDARHEALLGRQVPARNRNLRASGSEGGYAAPTLDGEPHRFAFRRLTVAPGWMVVIAEPEADYAAVWRPLKGLALGAALALLLGGLLALRLASRITRPLLALVRQVRGVAAGTAPGVANLPTARVTEIEMLRQGFAEAAAALGRSAAAARIVHARLAAAEARQRDLLSTMDLAALMTRDMDGTIRSWSAGCERLYGWSAAEAIGRSAHELLQTIFPVPLAEIEARLEREGVWSGELRHRRRDGSELVVNARKALRRGDGERLPQVVEAIADLTPLHHAEAALRRNEARWRAVVDSAADGILLATAEGRILSANAAALRMFGYPEEAALIGQDLGLLMPMPPGAAEAGRHGGFLVARQDGAVARILGSPGRELLGRRADGGHFPIALSVGAFESEGQGYVTGIIRDATERKAAEAALAQSGERLRLALEAGGMGAWDWELATGQVTWDAREYALCGLAPPPLGQPQAMRVDHFMALVVPEDRPALQAAIEGAARNGLPFAHEFRIRRADTGQERWLAGRGSLMAGSTGPRMTGLNWDVTERREAEERQLLLMREVDHRAKNSLAVVQSVLALTRAADIVGFRNAVNGRIGAMARAHTLLARTSWDAADLDTLLREELALHLAGGRVSLAGPVVGLAPGAAQPVAMALHELATNAAKYGALSTPTGRVALAWQRQPDGGLGLHWREADGPRLPAPPMHEGFGSVLLRRTVERQLHGVLALDWRPGGLDCRLVLPEAAVRWPMEPRPLSATG